MDTELTFVDEDPARFTTVDNAFLDAPGLSWKATALLVYLKGRPPGWKVRPSQLAKAKTDGMSAVKSGLRELETAGYLRRERVRDDKGRIVGVTCRFSWHPRWSGPQAGFPPVENPPEGNPPVENRAVVSTEVQQPLIEQSSPRRKRRGPDPDPLCGEVALILAGHLRALELLNPSSSTNAWAHDIDRMLRIDRVDFDELLDVISWLYQSDHRDARFWRTNVRSAVKLREKYPVLRAKRREATEDTTRQARQDLRTVTTAAADSQHPQLVKVKRLPGHFWSMDMAEDERRTWAESLGFTWDEVCAQRGVA
jgi:hypothetical protein